MPITTDSVTPVSSIAWKNASIPAVSWTKLRKWRWPSTIAYLGGFGSWAAAAAIDSSRREPKRRKLRRGCIGVFSAGSRQDARASPGTFLDTFLLHRPLIEARIAGMSKTRLLAVIVGL